MEGRELLERCGKFHIHSRHQPDCVAVSCFSLSPSEFQSKYLSKTDKQNKSPAISTVSGLLTLNSGKVFVIVLGFSPQPFCDRMLKHVSVSFDSHNEGRLLAISQINGNCDFTY